MSLFHLEKVNIDGDECTHEHRHAKFAATKHEKIFLSCKVCCCSRISGREKEVHLHKVAIVVTLGQLVVDVIAKALFLENSLFAFVFRKLFETSFRRETPRVYQARSCQSQQWK